MAGRLSGQVVVVTGAATGIGRAVTERFAEEGAHVVALVREGQAAPAAASERVEGDVREFATAEAAVARALDRFGRLDTFVANAGVFDYYKKIERLDPEDLAAAFAEVFGVNVLAAMFAARAAAAPLRQAGGSLIFTGSVASFRGGGGGCLYTASKFALRGLVLQLAAEMAPDVRVNAVAPGATQTPLAGPSSLGLSDRRMSDDARLAAGQRAATPLGFVAHPEDHTDLYVTLAARGESRAVTGAVLVSDGGLLASI